MNVSEEEKEWRERGHWLAGNDDMSTLSSRQAFSEAEMQLVMVNRLKYVGYVNPIWETASGCLNLDYECIDNASQVDRSVPNGQKVGPKNLSSNNFTN